MPADFFAQGDIHIYVRPRWYLTSFLFLGTAITSPQLRASLVYKNIESERIQPGPINKMLQTEQHVWAMVLNRVDHQTWNRIKTVGVAGGIGQGVVRRIESGRLVMGETDFELFFRYTHTFTQIPMPDSSPKGRLYYSAVILDYEEDAPSRTQELGLVLECNPLPKDNKFLLYSEREEDFPKTDAIQI
jgi:hypothetical protein